MTDAVASGAARTVGLALATARSRARGRLSLRRRLERGRDLIDHGIAADRLVAQGYGEARPIVQPSTDCRNGRIELTAIP
ncbi:MAG: hypothetical protein IPL61_22760 [Myxococcales bacterium]|nr:hypothetical protein [Myxococcales bacterium]